MRTLPRTGLLVSNAGEASLDATWPLTSPGVPSIRMLHNHFIVFPKDELRQAIESERFERAAQLRDRIQALRRQPAAQ